MKQCLIQERVFSEILCVAFRGLICRTIYVFVDFEDSVNVFHHCQ